MTTADALDSPSIGGATGDDAIPFAPGVVVVVRDEEWLITQAQPAAATEGSTETPYLLTVRGISPYVRDTVATFYTDLDRVEVLDPSKAVVVADPSPGYRRARLWLESTLRRTPVPLYDESLVVAKEMLATHLEYQLTAVKKALTTKSLRPRLLIADAVGLGKTLEIGMILAELIRRGRGDRILVVTPRHVLEQMQHELWCRFAIPLVRLDSVGIQKVRRVLPATRNPFTYFPRVIVSIDTLKSPKYRAFLNQVRWDAVVIDEIHNATNASTLNNELARILAPTTEALILASATPHNGNPESFAEILGLLDPTVVRPDKTVDTEALRSLVIRRHRHSPEVAREVGRDWAERAEPNNFLVPASPQETAVSRELHDTWTGPGVVAPSGDNRLFPWTLAKAFLSSPAALRDSLDNRRTRASGPEELAALDRLAELNDAVTPATSAKYQRLLAHLREIGIGKTSSERVVIFSERVPTLHWLRENLAKDLRMGDKAVKVMHGALSDVEQTAIVDEFKRESSPLRVLVTGDVASEGVNLHSLCHQLVHYDIPWSLIRIQQRNGRVDRYGQKTSPVITTLLLDPPVAEAPGDLRVLTRLMEREHEAHSQLSDVGSLMGVHSAAREEDAIRSVLQRRAEFDETVRTPEEVLDAASRVDDDEVFEDFGAFLDSLEVVDDETGAAPVVEAGSRRSLYDSEVDYLEDALAEAFHGDPQKSRAAGGVGWRRHDNATAQLEPPADLVRRLDLLPEDYVSDRGIRDTVVLATSTLRGDESLVEARTGASQTIWPKAHYLGPLHPVSEWASDRALASMARLEVPAVRGDVMAPTVMVMGTLMNRRGQVVTRAFRAVTFLGSLPAGTNLDDPYAWLRETGLRPGATNPGPLSGTEEWTPLVARAVAEARSALEEVFTEATAEAERRIDAWKTRSTHWQEQLDLTGTTAMTRHLSGRVEEERALAEQLRPEQRLCRPLLVAVPADTATEEN